MGGSAMTWYEWFWTVGSMASILTLLDILIVEEILLGRRWLRRKVREQRMR
jgi:hypothetical protein